MTSKLVRGTAHARQQAPTYAKVVRAEIIKLRILSPWIRWLFLELRMRANFSTGYLLTSWAQVESLMDCDGDRAFAPSREAIRRAVDELISLGFVERFADSNKARKVLFLWVMPVNYLGVSAVSADRPADRPSTRRKAFQPTDQPTGVSRTENQSLKSLRSPVDKPTITALQMQSRMKRRNGTHDPKI